MSLTTHEEGSMTRAARSIAIGLVLALLASGPLAPLEAAQKTQPAASAEQTQDASSMPSSAMDQGQSQQAQDQPAVPQAQDQQPQPQQAQEQPTQDQPMQDQPAIGQSQPQGQETAPGVITPAPARPTETATPPAPAPTPSTAQPVPPAGQTPVQASQPDQFKEKVKSSRAPKRGGDGYDAAAVVVNIFRPPGKAILCGLGGVAGTTLFLLTFGSAYRGTAAAFAEGCGGKWFINGNDLRPDSNEAGSFEWETHQFDWERK